MQSPSEESLKGFVFNMNEVSETAMQLLKTDKQLEKMRWLLVPWKVKEEQFWRNYFAHIFVIKQAILYSELAHKGKIRCIAGPNHLKVLFRNG